MCTMGTKLFCFLPVGDADDKSKVASRARLDARDGVFDDGSPPGLDLKLSGGFKEHVWGGLSRQATLNDGQPVNAHIEQALNSCR